MLVHIEFRARHGRAHALSRGVYPSALVNKTSPGYGIRGLSTPSRLGEDIWIWAPKFGSQAGSDGPAQL